MRQRFAICLFYFGWLTTVAVAQPIELCRVKTEKGPYLRFDQFTVNNEAFKQAYNKQMVLHDSRGYLWFISDPNAHEQLIRYDGTYYKSFGSEEWVTLKENEDHEIWGANKKGLGRFDPTTETFHHVRNPFTNRQNIGDWVMTPKGGNWFLAADSAQNRPRPFYGFNSHTHRFQRILPERIINGYNRKVESEKFQFFVPRSVSSTGRVWGFVYSSTYTIIGYYDAGRNAMVWYPVRGFLAPQIDKKSLPGQVFDIINIVEEDGKYVWVGGWNRMGLLRLDTQTGRWKQFYFAEMLFRRVFQFVRRNAHQFWINSDGPLAIFDTVTEKLYIYPHQSDNIFTVNPHSRAISMGQQQALWLQIEGSSSAAVSVLHETKQPFQIKTDSLLSNRADLRILYKKGGKIYCGYTDRSHLIFAAFDERALTMTPLYQLPLNGFIDQVFLAALPDSVNRTVWLAGRTLQGAVFRFDEKRQLVTPVRATIQGLPPDENQVGNYDEIRAVVQDKAGNVWFPSFGATGTYAGNLLKFDSRTKQFIGFRAGTHGLPRSTAQIRSAIADQQGKIWLGYRGGGGDVVRFDPVTNQAKVIIPNTHRGGTDAMKIVDDPARGLVWIARYDDGLWHYNRKTNTVQQVLTEPVLSVHLSKNNVLWLKTLTALVRYVPETGQQQRFGADYDLHNFTYSPFVKTTDDEFFFEKFRFYDNEIKPDTTKPTVVFSCLKVFDRELQLPRSINYTKAIDLNYDQNFFTVGFSVLSYFQSERNQYAYRLVGFNKDWVLCGNKPLAVFSNVPPDTYELQIKGSNNDGLWSEVKTMTIHVIPPFWQTVWFRLLAFLLLLSIVVTIYQFQVERRTLKSRLEAEEAKRLQKEAELNEKEAAYQLKLSQTEMAALRSQMNPHFIFNCLNSIQFFTAQNDAEKASDYLTKFSRLIRLVLENSKSERVTLANELETLRLYIEMEIMRFQQKVHYSIEVAEAIDTDSIQMPPLLLQPFVENAIWHGLMHKEEGGIVRVVVEQPQENRLHVEITDDGVGRVKAAEYKSKSATKNKSFGMKMTAERIELINQLYHTQTQVEIIDLVDAQGQAMGTKVVVDIPLGFS